MSLIDAIDEAIANEARKEKLIDKQVVEYGKEILKKYNCRKITGMIDERIYDYVDPDWEDDGDYESEHDWYIDFGRGEAESDIIQELVEWLQKKKRMKFDIDSFVAIGEYVADKCGVEYR